MTFLRAEALWALALLAPYAAFEALCVIRGRDLAGRLAPGAEAEASRRIWLGRRVGRALAGAWAWIFAVAAMAGPSWGFLPSPGPATGAEAALVLDVSHSMLSSDIPPSRLSAARDMSRALVRVRSEIPFSVTAFKGGAVLLCPLTDSPDALDQALEWAVPSAITTQGTSAAEGLRQALEGFTRDPGLARWIVLFSDGNDLAGGAAQAVREVRERGVRIFAVGCGGASEAPAVDDSGAPVKLADGTPARTSLRSDTLRTWARDSGGLYADLSDPAALRTISEALDSRPGTPGSRPARRPADRTGLAAFLALLGAALRAFLGLPAPPPGRGRRTAAVLLAVLGLSACSGPRLRVLEGNRLAERGRYEDAIAAYLSAGEREGEGIVALDLATVYSRMGEGTAADPLFALAESSRLPEVAAAAYHNRGVRLFESSRFDEAAQAFIRALRLVPQDIESKRALELARAAAAASRLSRASRREATSVGTDGRDEALLSLLRRADSGSFRPPAAPSSDSGGPDH